jgi:putative lipoic acid-binding regulatory protein
MLSLQNKKLNIKYPIYWDYKLIGTDEDSLILAIEEICNSKEYSYKKANVSSKGNFLSFYLKVLVYDDNDRNILFDNFKDHNNIKYVI